MTKFHAAAYVRTATVAASLTTIIMIVGAGRKF